MMCSTHFFSSKVFCFLMIGIVLAVNDNAWGLPQEEKDSKEFDKLTLRIESEYIYGSHRFSVDGATGKFQLKTEEIEGTIQGKMSRRQFELMNKVVRESAYLKTSSDEEFLSGENGNYFFTLERGGQSTGLGISKRDLTSRLKPVVDFFEKLIYQEELLRDLTTERGALPDTLLFINIDLDQALRRKELDEFTVLPIGFDRITSRLRQLATSDDPRLVSRASRALRAIRDLPNDYIGEPALKAKRVPQGDSMTNFRALNISFQSPIKDEVRIEADGWCRINDSWVKISEGELLRLDELCRATKYFRDKKAKNEQVGEDSCQMWIEMVSSMENIKIRGPDQTKAYNALFSYSVELINKYKTKTSACIDWQKLGKGEFQGWLKLNRPILIHLYNLSRSDEYYNFETAINSPVVLQALKKSKVVCLEGNVSLPDDPFADEEPELKNFQKEYFKGPGLALYDPKSMKIKPITFGNSVKVKEILIQALRQMEQ